MLDNITDIDRQQKILMEREKVEFIFVVVVYRNVDDLVGLLDSIKRNVSVYKTIIVNNYYDDLTKKEIQRISEDYDSEFINCENRGYGAGNNSGIRLALKKYKFDFLIISNPDIIIKKFPEREIRQYPKGVLGCEIYNRSGKKQNPMIVKDNKFAARLLYKGLEKRSGTYLFVGKAVNYIQRKFFRMNLHKKDKKQREIYQVHGSFVIFSHDIINKIGTPYDENMFLFGEEGYLAYLLKQKGIKSFYCPEVEVLHKEDGSMKFRDNIDEECVRSGCYFFEKHYFNSGDGKEWRKY